MKIKASWSFPALYCGYITYCLHLTLQTSRSLYCPVCFQRCTKSNTSSAACGHVFCDDCWLLYCISQLKIGLSSGMQWEKIFLFRCKCKFCNFATLSKITIYIIKGMFWQGGLQYLWHFCDKWPVMNSRAVTLNPLFPKGDQYQFSQYNVNV